MKKILSFLIVFVMLFVCGCSKTAKTPKGDKSTLLTDASWVGHDGACQNRISFGANNYFLSNCSCGKTHGNSDTTRFYSYNDKEKILTLYDGDGKTVEDAKILFVDESYLVTHLWDDVYVYENKQGHVPTVYDEAKEYVLGKTTKPCLAVLKFEDGAITVASHDYDGDTPDLFKKWKMTAAKDISFRVVSVTDNKGDVKLQRSLLSEEDYGYIGEYYTSGYFEFDQNGQVKSVTFYGEQIIQ